MGALYSRSEEETERLGERLGKLLRPGDVYCHCYQGKGSTIIDKNGHVYEAVRSARERGVLFDAANGTGIFAFSTAVAAIKDGFFPDIISADNASNSNRWFAV